MTVPETSGDPSPTSDKAICAALVRQGVLSVSQAREVFAQRDRLRRMLAQQEERKNPGFPVSGESATRISMADIIAARNFIRADGSEQELDEDAIYQALAREWGFPYKKIDPVKLDLNLVTGTIPRNFALRHLMIPVAIEDGTLVIATADPFNKEAAEDVRRVANRPVSIVVTSKSDIVRLINEFFGFRRSIAAAESIFSGSSIDIGNLEQFVSLGEPDEPPANDKHIVNAVNHIIRYAFDQRASDIHIEPKRDSVLVRMRIDGMLHTVYRLPKKVHSAIVSRIKNISRLDMAEKRRPQDGRVKMDKGGVEVEIRVSTVPVAFGEKVVMRIMDPDILFQDLEGLGFSENDLVRYLEMVQRPHGMVLVCGPTGSGKSTTLYSTLRRISSHEVNIVTIEDPIEMIHEDFNQIGVQPAVDVTFASILRNILRQDPDIIMVGELRDLETAENAVQAALTGHLVLSTLHTNDAPSAVIRLLDIGIPSFLIQATLSGVISQRLVRKICRKCIMSYEMDAADFARMGMRPPDGKTKVKLYRGRGCIICRGTGYFGRTGIFEVMPYSVKLRELTTPNADLSAIRSQAVREGMTPLREDAEQKMFAGITTLEEVLRVTWEQHMPRNPVGDSHAQDSQRS